MEGDNAQVAEHPGGRGRCDEQKAAIRWERGICWNKAVEEGYKQVYKGTRQWKRVNSRWERIPRK